MGRNIVVAAAGRKLGKSLLCSALAEAITSAGMKCAYYKLRPVTENGLKFSEGRGRKNSDTWRVADAGACHTGLLDYGPDSAFPDCLPVIPNPVDVVIWETNRLALSVPDAVIVYIHGETEEPKNPELAEVASIHLDGPLQEVRRETIGLILSSAGFRGFDPVKPGWKLWLQLGNDPIFGGGIATLLEAIRDNGSILAASKTAGIQYRRVWTLISRTEQKLGVRLINRSRGGSGGGGSTLTPVAAMLLERFHFLENAMSRAAAELEDQNR